MLVGGVASRPQAAVPWAPAEDFLLPAVEASTVVEAAADSTVVVEAVDSTAAVATGRPAQDQADRARRKPGFVLPP